MFNVVSLVFCKKLVGISIWEWIQHVVKPVMSTVAFNVLIGSLLLYGTGGLTSVVRFFIVVPVIVISATVINWLLLTDKDEKMRIKQMIAGLRKNIFNKRPTFKPN